MTTGYPFDRHIPIRMIFDLYLEGLGEIKICKELCRRQRKDGHGNVSWSVSKISRILRNATYMGYKCYLKSYSNNYLEQKRVKNLDEDSYLYVKGKFEPIISEDVFLRCKEIRESRTTKMVVNKGVRTYGMRASQDVWLRKLRCSCGSRFRKNKWRTNKRGDSVYGYQCYNQSNNGSRAFRERNGLDTEGYCGMKMIADWKLELMVKEVFRQLWANKPAVLEAYKQFNIRLFAVQKALDENIDLHDGHLDPGLVKKYMDCLGTEYVATAEDSSPVRHMIKKQTYADIAIDHTLSSPSTAERIYRQALEKMRKALEEEGWG